MVGNLRQAGGNVQGGVPRPSPRAVEPVELPRLRISKARVYEARVRNPMHKLAGVDRSRSAMLGLKTGAGGAFDFRQSIEIVVVDECAQARNREDGRSRRA